MSVRDRRCRTDTSPWGNEDTQTIIDILGRYNVKATFFLVGQWVDKYPESVKALADAGIEIGSHSDDHPHMAKLSEKQIIDQVSLCSGKIEAITGGEVKLFRCPYGEYDDQVISTIRNMGVQPIQWDVERSHIPERSCAPGPARARADLFQRRSAVGRDEKQAGFFK